MMTRKTKTTAPKSLKTSTSLGKKERDALLRKKKRKEKKAILLGMEAKRWYALIALSAFFSILLFPSILVRPQAYKLGDIADRDVKADRRFLVENTDLTEKNREDALKAALYVYDYDPTAANIASKIKDAFELGRDYLTNYVDFYYAPEIAEEPSKKASDETMETVDSFKSRFFEILAIPFNDGLIDTLIQYDFPKDVENFLLSLVSQVFKIGVVGDRGTLMSQSGKGIILHDIADGKEKQVGDLSQFYDVKSAEEFVKERGEVEGSNIRPLQLKETALEMALLLIKPNLTFNKRETAVKKEEAQKSVKPFYFMVKKGEMLVREGERITSDHLLKISGQNRLLKQNDFLGRFPAMAVFITLFMAVMYLGGLLTRASEGSAASSKDLYFFLATLLTIFLVVIAFDLVSGEIARGFHYFGPRVLLFAIPVASGAMLISIFQGIRVAASFSLVVSVLACLIVDGRVGFFVYFFTGSLVAASGVTQCRERGVFIRTGLKVGLCNMIMALCLETLYGSFFTLETGLACCSAFMGGILVGIVVTGILPLVEMTFGYTTDIKLLELASLDQPLLRELMVQAPGTYHHSVIVSNLVEASAQAIHANPLLSKVAAYYHDIGKIKKPLYFIENQRTSENKHEKLAPSMSSLILTSHVKDGVELARKFKLGKEIIEIIRQHHGTSLISFFYEKAKNQAEKKGEKNIQVKEEDFRYPGPKPQTKEAGLVMLADQIQAASKTLVDPTTARIQGMVQKMMNKAFSDGQLDECELTLKDLHEIAKSFNQTLSGIFHHRIAYPEPIVKNASGRVEEPAGNGTEKSDVSKKGKNGDTDQLSKTDSAIRRAEDKAENGESLKRLGLR